MRDRTIWGLLAAAPATAIVILQVTRGAEAAVVDDPGGANVVQAGGMEPHSLPALALATVKITVDFGNTSTITESCGTEVTASSTSNLSQADKDAIMNKIKAKYEAVLGAGNVTVTEEAIAGGVGTGDYGVIISGGKGPGGEYGDAGSGAGKPAIVHLGYFKNKGFSGAGLLNGVSETAAHEVAHRIGVSHNGDKSKLMTSGTNVSKAQREADARPFSDDDKTKIEENLDKNTEPKESGTDKDVNSQCGAFPDSGQDPDYIPDDHVMGAVIWYDGSPDLSFGYLNIFDEFIFQGTAMFPGDPYVDEFVDTMPFLHTGVSQQGWVLALSDGVQVFPFDAFGLGTPTLSNPNPQNPAVFLMATLLFDLDGDLVVDHGLYLDASLTGPHSGGFVPPGLSCTPDAGDCCAEGGNDTPGCDDTDCCTLVCLADPWCCDVVWDSACATLAHDLCDVCAALDPCPSDCEDPRDGTVDVGDFLALLAQWGQVGTSCDADGDGVGVTDFLRLLADWGSCPGLVPAGVDCWEAQCGLSEASFCEYPIPADFFEPGSEPFEGAVRLEGPTDEPDTVTARLMDLVFAEPSQSEEIPTEMVQLSLVSCEPITVMVNGQPEPWDVAMDLSEPQPPGVLAAVKTHANGGVFNATFYVQPRFTFTKVGDPSEVRVFDTGLMGIPPDHLFSVGDVPWVHQLEPGSPVVPCGINFVPGVEQAGPGEPQSCVSVRLVGAMLDLGLVIDEDCLAFSPGACCLPDGSCLVAQDESECASFGGQYGGDGTSCAADSDDDGIADVRESNDCCGPGDPCATGTSPVNPDTDGDGCIDGLDPAPCDGSIGC